jgi:hypothetical protein
LSADFAKNTVYVQDLLGSIWSVDLKTKVRKSRLQDAGFFTGISLQAGVNKQMPEL